MKYFLYITLLYATKSYCADSTATKPRSEPPVRYFYRDGSPIEPEWVPIIHEKDCNENGWRFRGYEWKEHIEPEYLFDPEHGSNGGWAIA